MDVAMSTQSNIGIKKDLRRVVLASTCVVLALLMVMMFSPLASQFDEEGSSRGAASYYETAAGGLACTGLICIVNVNNNAVWCYRKNRVTVAIGHLEKVLAVFAGAC